MPLVVLNVVVSPCIFGWGGWVSFSVFIVLALLICVLLCCIIRCLTVTKIAPLHEPLLERGDLQRYKPPRDESPARGYIRTASKEIYKHISPEKPAKVGAGGLR